MNVEFEKISSITYNTTCHCNNISDRKVIYNLYYERGAVK